MVEVAQAGLLGGGRERDDDASVGYPECAADIDHDARVRRISSSSATSSITTAVAARGSEGSARGRPGRRGRRRVGAAPSVAGSTIAWPGKIRLARSGRSR